MVVQNIRNNGAGVDNTKLGGVGQVVAKQLEELTGLEARNTTLGYMQRGGTPTAFDRVLSTKYGSKAMELALEGKFGTLVVIKNGKLDSTALAVSSSESYVFDTNKKFISHWKGNNCYNENGELIITREKK